MKTFVNSLRRKIRSFGNSLRRVSLTRWGLIVAIVTGLISLAAWLLPNPFGSPVEPVQAMTIAESFGINKDIPPKKEGVIRVIVADFDETKDADYKMTELIYADLLKATEKYKDVEIIGIDRTISEQNGKETAIKIGEYYDASIVIWGWYGLTNQVVPLGVHFEVIPTSTGFSSNTCASSRARIRSANVAYINDLTLQFGLGKEYSLVTIFTLAVSRLEAEDYTTAVLMFDDALSYLDAATTISAKVSTEELFVDKYLIYYYRGLANLYAGNYKDAIDDFLRSSANEEKNYYTNYYLARAYSESGDVSRAFESYSNALLVSPSNSFSSQVYYYRGLLYEAQGDFDKANTDFVEVLKADQYFYETIGIHFTDRDEALNRLGDELSKNTGNAVAYYLRGLVYKELGETQEAVSDFSKTLDIYPDNFAAREIRANLYIELKMYEQSIQDFDYIFGSDVYRTPCNLVDRGGSYFQLGKKTEAKADYLLALDLSNKQIDSDPLDVYAIYTRALAYDNLQQNLKAYADYKLIKRMDPNFPYLDGVNKNTSAIVGQFALPLIAIAMFGLFFYFMIRDAQNYKKRHGRH